MIKINNKDYTKYDTKITWGDFYAYSNEKKEQELLHLFNLI